MQKSFSSVVIGALLLVVGFFSGYVIRIGSPAPTPGPLASGPFMSASQGAHVMPDGTMMRNAGNSMQDMMDDMSADLRGKTGDEFDKAFLDEMIVHHQGAIDMAKHVQATSKRPELLKLANDIITAQTGEIELMTQWRSTWFGATP